jgi:hypothetical protein
MSATVTLLPITVGVILPEKKSDGIAIIVYLIAICIFVVGASVYFFLS